jgi:DNA-binding LacI/PurR family transcriptional regulator
MVVKYASGDSVSTHLSAYLEKSGVPDGFLCTTDGFFIETVKFLRSRGLRVPGEAEVTGSFFFSPWNEILDPPLPIVCQDYNLIADRAVKYLVERIEGSGPAPVPRLDLVPANYLHEN